MAARRKKKDAPEAKSVGASSAFDKHRAILAKMGEAEHIVDIDNDRCREQRPHITTGSLILDRQLGGPKNQFGVIVCPGFLKGGIINLYGHESSGKTTLALTTAAKVNKNGGKVAFLDWEYAFAPDYAARIGIDPNLFMLFQPNTLEQGIKFLMLMTEEDPELAVDLLILDSVSAGLPEVWLSGDDNSEAKRLGLVASKWSRTLPELKARMSRHGTTLIGISQLRTASIMSGGKKGPSGPKDKPAGGKVWGYMSDVKMKLRKVATRKEKILDPITNKIVETPCGAAIRSTLEKCKSSSAMGSQADFVIRQGFGIDNMASAIEILTSRNLIVQSGSWYAFPLPNGEEFRCQGSERLRTAILDNPEAMTHVYKTANELLYGG